MAAYLAQDFVAADSLDTVVREHGAAPPAEALRVVTAVAGALDAAAAVGILHGSLHPRDVLISTDDARITGLGITQALGRIGFTAPIRRPYTAPERASGDSWDRRADIFSLAALTHELLWGKRISATGRDAAAAITPVHGMDIDALRPLLARALADNPADRFETAGELADALKTALAPLRHHGAETSSAPTVAVGAEVASAPRLPLGDEVEDTVAAPPPPPPHGPDEDDTVPDTRLEVDDADDTMPEAPLQVDGDDTVPETPLQKDDVEDTVPDVVLRGAEDAWFADAETAPSVVEPPVGSASDFEPPPLMMGSDAEFLPKLEADAEPPTGRPLERPPSLLIHPATRTTSPEPTRAGVWPIALALFVGVALGFSGGYWLGSVERDETAAPPVVAEAAPKPIVPANPQPAPSAEGTEVQLPPSPSAPANKSVPPSAAADKAAANGAAQRRLEAAPASKPPAARPGRILVRSTPAGARVTVDGRDAGKTPVTVRELTRGAHTVRISHDGYRTEERRVTVTAAQPSRTVTVQLPRSAAPRATPPSAAPAPAKQTASLVVESRPSGATVLIDGKRIGTTPLSIDEVAGGSHAVRLELDGYRPWTASVRVVAGEKNRVAASLER